MSPDLLKLIPVADCLEAELARAWEANRQTRWQFKKQYRELRRVNLAAARQCADGRKLELAKVTVEEIDSLLDALCGQFVHSDEPERAELMQFFGERPRLLGNLQNYASRSATRMYEKGDREFLLRGLAAVVLDAGRSLQGFTFTLGKLYSVAKFHGIQPMPLFVHFGEIADDDTKRLLVEFENSDDFKVCVSDKESLRSSMESGKAIR